MHPRNIFRDGVKYTDLAEKYEFFRPFVITDSNKGKTTLNFDDRDAVIALNKVLLLEYFDLNVDIPGHCLIPRIPLRVNYILWIEDLLTEVCGRNYDQAKVIGIDIGTGPCAVYALLAARMNNWNMFGTDINTESVKIANENVLKNSLEHLVKIFQVDSASFFKNIRKKAETNFTFSMCNPPFFSDAKDSLMRPDRAEVSWEEKSGVVGEVICEGGEVNFITRMIRESREHQVVKIFTTMVGVKKHLLTILKLVKGFGLTNFTTTVFHQGKTSRWGLAWSWDPSVNLQKKVSKPRIGAQFEATFPNFTSLSQFNAQVLLILTNLDMETEESSANKFLVKAVRNSWSHARRKRRMKGRENQESSDTATQPHGEMLASSSVCDEIGNALALSQSKMAKLDKLESSSGAAEYNEACSSLRPLSSSRKEDDNDPTTSIASQHPSSVEYGLCFKLCTYFQGCDASVRLQYESGSLGVDGLHQVLQYLKNQLVQSKRLLP